MEKVFSFLSVTLQAAVHLGIARLGMCEVCGWEVVQLDYDEEMGPLHGMARGRQKMRSSAPSRGRS